MLKKLLWILAIILAIAIGFYPVIYFLIDPKFGLLQSKSDELMANVFWNAGFYSHIVLGGLALLIGWIQFSKKIRDKHLNTHRLIGKSYVGCVIVSSLAAIGIGFFATGGPIAATGFIALGVTWFTTTVVALRFAVQRKVERHRKMMIYSYAACFAAVTLRIWLPLLTMAFGDFIFAYRIVAWLCWVPNILVAAFITRK